MAVRKLLVPLAGIGGDGAEAEGLGADDVALATAALVARRWGAHVLAVHFPRSAAAAYTHGPDVFPVGMIDQMVHHDEAERASELDAARARFASLVARHGLREAMPVPGVAEPTAELVVSAGRPDETVAQMARLADLTVVPHLDFDRDAMFGEALHAALFDSGRPVLVAPRRPADGIGRRIAIAWNGTAESASGVQAVLPWLERAEAVRVLTATGYQRRGPDAGALAEYLALHGIRVDVVSFPPHEGSVGLGLLRAAGEFGADLLAMGAYSHPRWRQMILGGVTRSVLERAALPVLMSR